MSKEKDRAEPQGEDRGLPTEETQPLASDPDYSRLMPEAVRPAPAEAEGESEG